MSVTIREILPERIPWFAAVLYNAGPARIMGPQYTMVAAEVRLPENGLLLDIGTGPGDLPVEIAKRFPAARIAGIDLSPKMIQIATRRALKAGTRNIEFMVMNAGAMLFPDNSVDMVISTGSFHHWKNAGKILDEIYRVLRPGCEAWIYDGYGDVELDDARKYTSRVIFGFPSGGLVKKLMSIHGFSRAEYDTRVKEIIAGSRFGAAEFEPKGIMMRMRLTK